MTISELVIDGDSKNSLPTMRTWCWLSNTKPPELFKPHPLAVPHYRGEMGKRLLPPPSGSEPMSGEAQTVWHLDQAVLLLFLRTGHGVFLPSSPNEGSTPAFHTACTFAVIFLDHLSALGVLKALSPPPLPMGLWENALLLNYTYEASRYHDQH